MVSHYSTIGLGAGGAELFSRLADRAEIIQARGGRYLRWRAGNGAELWIQVSDQRQLLGATPYFERGSAFPVRIERLVSRPEESILEGAIDGRATWGDGSVDRPSFPMVVDIVDFGRHRDIVLPLDVTLRLSAFAHELTIYESEERYLARREPGKYILAPESFVPLGKYAPRAEPTDPPDALALFVGRILVTASLVNPATGATFDWVLVKTLGGTIDVVADPAIRDLKPVPGGILAGTFWLCGRIADRPSAGMWEGLARLFGKPR